MSEIRSRRKVDSKKKKKKKSHKTFLLTSKKCWLIEDKLLPLYQHLVDSYSVNLRAAEWNVRVEESDIDATPQVMEGHGNDNFTEPQSLQLNSSTNQFQVIISHGGLNILSLSLL